MNTYRAAIVLNNQGISMMKNSCYDQAFHTFKDAFLLMKMAPQERPAATGCPELQLVRQKLDEATRRISSPIESSPSSLVEVVSHNDADLNNGTVKDAEHLIRFDTSDTDILEEESKDLCAAIILSNYGVCSILCRRQESGMKYLAFALQILQGMSDRVQQDDPFVLKRVVFISTIVLNILIPAQLSCGMFDDAQDNAEKLTYLTEVACTIQDCGLFTRDFELCASAA
jgi:hypothetical protein